MGSTMTFRAQFTRYDKDTGEREMSALHHFPAETFAEAIDRVQTILFGMAQADAARDYEIVALGGVGYHGDTCTGPGLWGNASPPSPPWNTPLQSDAAS